MKKVRLFFAMVLMTISMIVTAQTTTVKGVVTDKNSGEAEPFATIRVYKNGNLKKPVAFFLADENGAFSHEVEGSGKYTISFTSIGKEELRQEIELGKTATLDMATVALKEDSKTLKGVEVIAQKPLVIRWRTTPMPSRARCSTCCARCPW